MFLSIDAGNSNIVFGFYDQQTHKWEKVYRVPTKREITASYLEKRLRLYFLENGWRPAMIGQVGISSVVPEVNAPLQEVVRAMFHLEAHLINERSYASLAVRTARPAEMGTDLMANAVAAFGRYRSACIVVDFGTALTFTVVDAEGEIVGVNIVPGLKTAIKSLFMNTSKLPEVRLELPQSAVGKDTIHSIQAGILYGYTGLVKGMLDAIRNELGGDFKVIATGGLSSILTNLQSEFDDTDGALTLEGIRLIALTNLK